MWPNDFIIFWLILTILFPHQVQIKVTIFILNLKDDKNKSCCVQYIDICLIIKVFILRWNDNTHGLILETRSKGQCYVVDIIYLKSKTYFEKSNFNKLQNIIDFFSKETIIIFFSNLQSSLVSVSLFVFKSVRVGLFVDKPSLFDIQKNKGLSYEVEHSVSTIF